MTLEQNSQKGNNAGTWKVQIQQINENMLKNTNI
uniref:Uncharacterized protein n=1 Tax=Anguilla anguilla TaxID=7936 RepID=A0A0E9W2B7_ANGAN